MWRFDDPDVVRQRNVRQVREVPAQHDGPSRGPEAEVVEGQREALSIEDKGINLGDLMYAEPLLRRLDQPLREVGGPLLAGFNREIGDEAVA